MPSSRERLKGIIGGGHDLRLTPSQPFSLRDASRDVGYGNSKTHVQNIRERDCSFVTDL